MRENVTHSSKPQDIYNVPQGILTVRRMVHRRNPTLLTSQYNGARKCHLSKPQDIYSVHQDIFIVRSMVH